LDDYNKDSVVVFGYKWSITQDLVTTHNSLKPCGCLSTIVLHTTNLKASHARALRDYILHIYWWIILTR